MGRSVLAVFWVGSLGCASAVLSTERSAYAPGEDVVLVLTNQAATDVGYNLCFSALEQELDSRWETVPDDRICTSELRLLHAFGEATSKHPLPPEATGTFRFVTRVELGGDNHELVTEPFSVGVER